MVYNLIQTVSFVALLVLDLAIGNSVKLVLCCFSITPIVFLALPYFVAPQDISGSLIFFCPSPDISHFSKQHLVPFIQEWYLEIKIWALGIFIAIRVLLLHRPFQHTELWNICMYVNTCITHIWIYCCISISVYYLKKMKSYWYLQFQSNIT